MIQSIRLPYVSENGILSQMKASSCPENVLRRWERVGQMCLRYCLDKSLELVTRDEIFQLANMIEHSSDEALIRDLNKRIQRIVQNPQWRKRLLMLAKTKHDPRALAILSEERGGYSDAAIEILKKMHQNESKGFVRLLLDPRTETLIAISVMTILITFFPGEATNRAIRHCLTVDTDPDRTHCLTVAFKMLYK